jgi:hypothetical protein
MPRPAKLDTFTQPYRCSTHAMTRRVLPCRGQGKVPDADLTFGRFAFRPEECIPPQETPKVGKGAHLDQQCGPLQDVMCWWWQEISAYKELLELLPAKGVYLSAVLPDESGPAVVLPGVCRLNRVEGYGGAQTRPLLLIGKWRTTSRYACTSDVANGGGKDGL